MFSILEHEDAIPVFTCTFTCMYAAVVMEFPFFNTASRSGYLEDAIADHWKYGFNQPPLLPHSPDQMV